MTDRNLEEIPEKAEMKYGLGYLLMMNELKKQLADDPILLEIKKRRACKSKE